MRRRSRRHTYTVFGVFKNGDMGEVLHFNEYDKYDDQSAKDFMRQMQAKYPEHQYVIINEKYYRYSIR